MRNTFRRRTRSLAILALGLVLLGAAAWAADRLFIVQEKADIRERKRQLSRRLAVVKGGEQVTVLGKEPPWYRVAWQDVRGWMHESAVSTDSDMIPSTTQVASGVRPTEQSAAGRGFGPKVEEQYRTQHRDREAAFALVDKIAGMEVPEGDVLVFLRAGGLAGAEEAAVGEGEERR